MPYSIVKLDQDLRLAILEKVGVYSVRFSIQEPRTLLATKEVLDMPSEMTSGRRTSAYKYYGVSYMYHNLVFINVRKIPDEKVLENTIVHERRQAVLGDPPHHQRLSVHACLGFFPLPRKL